MAEISVQILGLEKLQAGVAAGPATLAAGVRVAMETGSLLIEGTARLRAPKDTGRLAGSITHAISGSGANLTAKIGPSVAYGYWVEFGRAAGKMPPPTAASLQGWARRHGGQNPYALAKAIGAHGTKKQPYLVPAFRLHEGKIKSLFEALGVPVVARMAG